jgi:chemotaxis protein methyltransferase CheR
VSAVAGPPAALLGGRELAALARVCGIPLASYRRAHVETCVGRSLARSGVQTVGDLVSLCQRDPAAKAALLRSVLVPTTRLFRDPEQFELLEKEILPGLVSGRRGVRVWSAGCSDGSELYSVALVLRRLGALAGARLVGSDVLEERIVAARRGDPAQLPMPADVRAAVRWECRDLVCDAPPPGPFDLVLCRNVLIYFEPPVHDLLQGKLAAALGGGGVLMLGRSERLLQPGRLGLAQVAPHAYRREAA